MHRGDAHGGGDLGDGALVQGGDVLRCGAEDLRDLVKRQALVPVQGRHQLLVLGQPGDRVR